MSANNNYIRSTIFGDLFSLLLGRFSEGFMVDFETTLNALTTYRFFIAKDIVSALLFALISLFLEWALKTLLYIHLVMHLMTR